MPATDPSFEHADEDLWVFAYGSLMWRPGFEAPERAPARPSGAHRALCVWSHVHRGSPERPGLVLGLDFGGMCRGLAYRVAAAYRKATIDYLRAREQVTMVYRECVRPIVLLSHPERRGKGRRRHVGPPPPPHPPPPHPPPPPPPHPPPTRPS